MRELTRSIAALLCVLAVSFGGTAPAQLARIRSPYTPISVPPPQFVNSNRLKNLIRAGNLYLSLQDAIALALENNLDIELQRYDETIANSDVLRASGGGLLRGVPLEVNTLPPGVGGPASPLLNLPASGTPGTTSVPVNLTEATALSPAQISPGITGTTPLSNGSPIPVFDPALMGQLNWEHQTTPEVNPLVTGANSLVDHDFLGNLGFEKGFALGTQISASFDANNLDSNSNRNLYNPYTTSSLSISVVQPLLRGFGIKLNRRFIRIANNNRKVTDLVFRQQAITTVYGVVNLYYDLVSQIDDVNVKRETLALAQRLYEDNKSKVTQGTLAPIELVRAQAQVAASRQDLANSEGFEREQELVLKTVLSRNGTADPLLREVRVIPTDSVPAPMGNQTRPVEELVAEATRQRPEVQTGELQISNSQIGMEGSRNELLPELDLVGIAQNTGLAGSVNPMASLSNPALGSVSDMPFIGGFGSSLAQILRRNYPTYGIGLQLNLPLRNRVAQADYERDLAQVRQSQVRFQQVENQVRLEVEAALIALQRSRAAYEAAVETRTLQEQSLKIEMEKYENGVSTTYLVLQYQSYLAQARSTEVAAKSVYAKARNEFERALGETLENHNIQMADVLRGHIATPPSPLPPVSSNSPGQPR